MNKIRYLRTSPLSLELSSQNHDLYPITPKNILQHIPKNRAYSQQENIWFEIRENRAIWQCVDNQHIDITWQKY